jgi:hypothetical protein
VCSPLHIQTPSPGAQASRLRWAHQRKKINREATQKKHEKNISIIFVLLND